MPCLASTADASIGQRHDRLPMALVETVLGNSSRTLSTDPKPIRSTAAAFHGGSGGINTPAPVLVQCLSTPSETVQMT